MANLGATFDATTVEPSKPFEVLPPGRYVAHITASEIRATKDGQGQYLWLELDVLEGEHHGRKLFDRLNLVNANPTTVEIAQQTLSAICHAVGKLQVQDSEELHLIPLVADVKVKPSRTEGYGPSNTLRYLSLDHPRPAPTGAQTPPQAGSGGATTPTSAPATRPGGSPPPWRRTT